MKCTREEAEQVYQYDMNLKDKEPTEFDLPPDKLKVAQKFAHTGTRKAPTAFKFAKKERKPNATKGGLIEELARFLAENSDFSVENLEIVNKERQISFTVGENKFDLTLIQKRKPKK